MSSIEALLQQYVTMKQKDVLDSVRYLGSFGLVVASSSSSEDKVTVSMRVASADGVRVGVGAG